MSGHISFKSSMLAFMQSWISGPLMWIDPVWCALSKRRRHQLLILQVLSVLSGVSEVISLFALLTFLKAISNTGSSLDYLNRLLPETNHIDEFKALLYLSIILLLILSVGSAIRIVTLRFQQRLVAIIATDLAAKVFANVLYRPFSWHIGYDSSRVISHLTKDIEQVNISVQSLLALGVNLTTILFLSVSLITLSPVLVCSVGLILAYFYFFIFKIVRKGFSLDGLQVVNEYEASLKVAQDGLGGIRNLILDQSQSYFLDSYKLHNFKFRLAQSRINIKSQIPRCLIELVAVSLILGLSLFLTISGQNISQQLPLLGTLVLGAYRLLQPLQQSFTCASVLRANLSSFSRLEQFLEPVKISRAPLDIIDSRTRMNNDTIPLLSMQNLDFSFEECSELALRDINLEISPGEFLAIVGFTGSGKSTLSDLILGMFKPSRGSIMVYGKDLYSTPGLHSLWRKSVAQVPQHIYLSNASFMENIAFGVPYPMIDKFRVRESAKQAHISEFIESKPEGYETLVGQNGLSLSGGQRQRLGLARAFYKQADLLVLDEATSALDNATECDVVSSIDKFRSTRKVAVIAIAHRLETIKQFDRLVMLNKGQIVGIGTFRDLAASNIHFQKLIGDKNVLAL